MNIFLIFLVAITVFLFLIKLIAALTGRVSERLLTNHFRALEALIEHDQLPADWITQLQKMARGHPIRRHFASPVPLQETAKPFLLKKIRQLSRFFANSPFVESPEARTLLLEELDVITKRWENSELAEIFAYYDLPVPRQNDR